VPLPDGDDVRIGVNSFGWGGTNAHVVLAPRPAPARVAGRAADERTGPFVLPISAHTEPALDQRLDDVLRWIDGGTDAREVAGALAWHRDHFPERLALVMDGPPRMRARGRAREVGRVAFVFPGQGAQWSGWVRTCSATTPLSPPRSTAAPRALLPVVGWDLRETAHRAARR
jgi:phthiocerol/phenolphthiocerol synthesis type-I polyketide synthase C